MGIALSVPDQCAVESKKRDDITQTFVEDIAHGAVIKDHDSAKVSLYMAKILNVRPVSKGTVLSIVSLAEIFTFQLKPVNNRVRVLLHRRSKTY